MKTLVLLLFFTLLSIDSAAQAPGTKIPSKNTAPIFVLRTDEFWLNLHHFLYVLARAQNKERDASRTAVARAPADAEKGLAKLSQKENVAWKQVVDAYAVGLAKKDAVFDEPLPTIVASVAKAGNARTLKGTSVDAATAAILEKAAPIYKKAFWPAHRSANREWEKMIRPLIRDRGHEILSFLTTAYDMTWPAGFPVHLSAYANWAGAYSITGNLLVVSSLAPDIRDNYGLETIFHEGMHQWDDQIDAALKGAAQKAGVAAVPDGLSHALIFYTAGEAARRAITGHVPYAEKFGIWQRGLARFKIPIVAAWLAHLEGQKNRDEALAELLRRTRTTGSAGR